jgi:hypothetical protein
MGRNECYFSSHMKPRQQSAEMVWPHKCMEEHYRKRFALVTTKKRGNGKYKPHIEPVICADIAMCYGLHSRGVGVASSTGIGHSLFFSTAYIPALRPIQLSARWVPGGGDLPQVLKRLEFGGPNYFHLMEL